MKKNIWYKGRRFIFDSDYRFDILSNKGYYGEMSDEEYLRRKFKVRMNYFLNLETPKTFNEKLQWLKLYDRRPEYITMVDKFKVREYIAEHLGEQYLIPLLGVWDDPEDIDFDKLPDQFVLKCNHNSGLGMCICKDKSKLDIKSIKRNLRKGLKQNYYLIGREWPYKDVPRKIIAEKYMVDYHKRELIDYKIHNFNGVPKFILVCSERFSELGLHEDFYNLEWEKMDVRRPNCPKGEKKMEKPKEFKKMLEFSKLLSRNYPFMRTDFYEVNDKLYFGELTLYPASGFESFVPNEWDNRFGEWIVLPNKK